MIRKLVLLAAVTTVGLMSPMVAMADDSGMASIHDLRREGGRICMSDHWHYGNGTGGSRKSAEADAIGSWSSFTAMEYGSDWARFKRAASRKVACSPSSSGFDCSVEARPCR
ncbi:MAG: hypothetical protein NW216_08755 [Hyphomicrobium sp.]|nr:hypothetical protein [Hyphomicrobium sp.]